MFHVSQCARSKHDLTNRHPFSTSEREATDSTRQRRRPLDGLTSRVVGNWTHSFSNEGDVVVVIDVVFGGSGGAMHHLAEGS